MYTQVLVYSNHCTQDLLHTLECTGTALKTQPGSVTARESIPSAWDRLQRAEVTKTERSELCTHLRLCRGLPPAEAEPRLGSWASGREKNPRNWRSPYPWKCSENMWV